MSCRTSTRLLWVTVLVLAAALSFRIATQLRPGELEPEWEQQSPTTSNGNPAEYAEYDEDRQEYRIKLHVNTPNGSNNTICVPWTINGDHWWTHHREWELGPENATHYCFQRVQNPVKARFFQTLYQIQWGETAQETGLPHCDRLVVKRMWSSGWGADMLNVVDALRHARRTGRPVQMEESTPWHYAYPKRSVDSSKAVQAACPLKNIYCYLLPMTDCSSTNRTTADSPFLEGDTPAFYTNSRERYRWYVEWLVRPQTWLRRRVYEYIRRHAPVVRTPCTALHVRRNDVVLHGSQARKYHPIGDYLRAGVGANVLLLTDDHNAIGEATTLFPDHHWMYLDRPRFRGVGGWEHQTPSDDPVLEVVVLFALFQLIRHCDRFIMSSGKFSSYLYQEMMWNRKSDDPVELIDIDLLTKDPKDVIHPANYLTHIVSKNYDPEDWTADKNKKRLTAGGKRFVGNPIEKDKDFDGPFCQTWDVDADEWWTHHPTWEMGADNRTHYCFKPIADAAKAELLQDLYQVQFMDGDCNRVFTKRMSSSGWGADIETVVDGLLFALRRRRPVQIGLDQWHYADPVVEHRGASNRSFPTAACPRRNMFCYFLELSRCQAGQSRNGLLEQPRRHRPEYVWLQEYATRPQTWLRKRVFDFVRKQRDEYFKGDCAVIDVRPGDVVVDEEHPRKYHAISKYMEIAEKEKMSLNKNILLLADDRNIFAEAKKLFPAYNWMQIDRPRTEAKGAKGKEDLASNDPVFIMVVMQSIFQLVKQCDQFVYSTSSFADHIAWAMNRTSVKLNIDQGKEGLEYYNPNDAVTIDTS